METCTESQRGRGRDAGTVSRITVNFRQLRRLEKSLRNGNLTDLQTVREVLSIQHEELTWGIQNPNIATLRRKRVEVGALSLSLSLSG